MAQAQPGFTVQAYQREPLDALVWRALGRGSGAVEAVLAANPGLAGVAQAMPEGQVVFLPLPAATPPRADVVKLWD